MAASLSAADVRKSDALLKEDVLDVHICLFQESMPFVKSTPPLPSRSLSFLRAAYVPPSLH